jgi:hypothetical protein
MDADRHKEIFVIPGAAQTRSGLWRQNAGANIGAVDGAKGEPRMRQVIHVCVCVRPKRIPGSIAMQPAVAPE